MSWPRGKARDKTAADLIADALTGAEARAAVRGLLAAVEALDDSGDVPAFVAALRAMVARAEAMAIGGAA